MAGSNTRQTPAQYLKISFFLMISICASCARTGWERVAEEDAGIVYLDYSQTKKDGQYTTVKYLMNYNESQSLPDGRSYSSTVNIEQFNCQTGEMRTMVLEIYDRPMADGSPIESINDVNIWTPVNVAGSIEAIWRVACD